MDGWLLAEAERWCDTHLYGPDEDDGWAAPRTRGDDPLKPRGVLYMALCSPHTRG